MQLNVDLDINNTHNKGMNKFYKLVEIPQSEASKQPFVMLTDNSYETNARGKINFALHTQHGSAIVCNLEDLINGIELAV